MWIEVFTGLRADRFARLLRAVRERGGEHPRMGRPWRLPLAERVLLVAVYYRTNLTMRQLAVLSGDGVPDHPAGGPAPLARAGAPPRGRGGTAVDRGRHADPGARPHRRRLQPQLPLLRERAGRHRCRHPAGGRRRAPGGGQHRRRPCLPGHRPGPGLRRNDGARRRRLRGHRSRDPASPLRQTVAAAHPGSRQRRTPQGPRPRRAHLRPDEELQDPPRLPAARRRSAPRRPGRRPHAQPRPRHLWWGTGYVQRSCEASGSRG